jgi:hypothetical protein
MPPINMLIMSCQTDSPLWKHHLPSRNQTYFSPSISIDFPCHGWVPKSFQMTIPMTMVKYNNNKHKMFPNHLIIRSLIITTSLSWLNEHYGHYHHNYHHIYDHYMVNIGLAMAGGFSAPSRWFGPSARPCDASMARPWSHGGRSRLKKGM